MKRLLLIATLGVATAEVGWCTMGTYSNTTVVTFPPQIDATNFVNLNYFLLNIGVPYEFLNVQNYTNRHVMESLSSGFRFDTVPTVGSRRMANTFFNAGLADNPDTNSRIYGEFQLVISATNIINKGFMGVGTSGSIRLDGKNLDLSRGVIQVGSPGNRTNTQAILDSQWQLGQVGLTPNNLVTSNSPSTPAYNVVQFTPQNITAPYLDAQDMLTLNGDTSTLLSGQAITEGVSNRSVQYVFVRNADTNVNVTVRFGRNAGQNPVAGNPRVPIIEWWALGTNAFGQVVTNRVYLSDNFALANGTSALVEHFPFASPPPDSLPIPPATYQPDNYGVTRTAPALWANGTAPAPFVQPGATIWTTNAGPQPVTADYSAYGFTLSSSSSDYSQMSPLAVTNARTGPGRIELNSGGNLNLDLARIEGLNYLKISATNHFAGASNATILAAYADVDLGSTNGTVDTSGVLGMSLPRIVGTVYCFSAKWQNVVYYQNGNTNLADFNVLYVDANLQGSAPAETLSLGLRGTNGFVSDAFAIVDKLNLDVRNLTIRDTGSIQVYPANMQWANSAPRLLNLTNLGTIDFQASYQEMAMYGLNSSGNAVPYHSFVNQGAIYNNSASVRATNLVNGGQLYSAYGPLSLTAHGSLTLLPGGYLHAPFSDLTIDTHNLSVTNHDALVGRTLRMSITGDLRASTNSWAVNDGFHLLRKPVTGDFFLTTITDKSIDQAEVSHTWAGADRGVTEAGFTNNAVLGELTLDGGIDSLFTFSRTGGAASNAIYIDRLNLTNHATRLSASGWLEALNISPGMKVYYAEATINGASAAEFLDGRHNGQLRWVSSHAGPFSGTAITYNGVTTNVNAALLNSYNIDSDGDGEANATDPTPFGNLTPPLNAPILAAKLVSSPSPGIALSWTSVGGAKNRIYSTTDSVQPEWQFVTNVICPAATGQPALMEVVVPADGTSRFYRVGVDSSTP